MEEESIVIEDSDILDLPDEFIMIEEDVLDENALLILNKTQIISELTTMLLNNYDNAKILKHKVDMFLELHDNSLNYNEYYNTYSKKKDFYLETLYPIINCKRKIDSLDKNYTEEKLNNDGLIINESKDFLSTLYDLNSKKSNTNYIDAAILLNSFTPFKTENDTKIYADKFIDSYRDLIFNNHNNKDTFRLIPAININIGKVHTYNPLEKTNISCFSLPSSYHENDKIKNLYKGDSIDIVGYYNKLNEEEPHIFDISFYLKSLKKIKIKDVIDVYFNDYVFDINGNIITNIIGKVIDVTEEKIIIKLESNIVIKDINSSEIIVDKNLVNSCFVYKNDYEGFKYHKSLLKTDSILFKLNNERLEYIIPKSLEEFIYVNRHSIKNIDDLKSLVNIDEINVQNKFLFDFTLPYKKEKSTSFKVKDSIKIYDGVKFLKFTDFTGYKDKYLYKNKIIDTDFNRYLYLKNKLDYGYFYILNYLKTEIHEKIKHKKLLSFKNDELLKKTYTSKDTIKENVIIIAKKYNSLNELMQDNDKEIYFDDEYLKELNEKGPKKVEDGHHALLEVKQIIDGEIVIIYILYKRKNIDSKLKWIKIQKVSGKLSNKKILEDNVMSSNDGLTFDKFEYMCQKIRRTGIQLREDKKNEYYKSIEKINELKEIAEDDELLEYYNRLLKIVKYEDLESLKRLRRPVNITISYEEDTNIYEGSDEIDYEKIFNNVEYGETQTYVSTNTIQKNDENTPLDDMLLIIGFKYEVYYSVYKEVSDILKQLLPPLSDDKESKVIIIDKNLLDELKKEFPDEFLEKKITKTEFANKLIRLKLIKINREYNRRKIIITAASLIAMIMKNDYNIQINKQFLTAFKKEKKLDFLLEYFSQLIKFLGKGEEQNIKYSLFKNENIIKLLEQELEENLQLSQINFNKDIPNFKQIDQNFEKYTVLNINFKPHNFNHISYNSTSSSSKSSKFLFLKKINDQFNTKDKLEKFMKNINYYNIFSDLPIITSHYKKASTNTYVPPNTSYISTSHKLQKDIIQKIQIDLKISSSESINNDVGKNLKSYSKKNSYFKNNELFIAIANNFNGKEWESSFNSEITSTISYIIDKCLTKKEDLKVKDIFRNEFEKGDIKYETVSARKTLFNYIKNHLISDLLKILNKKINIINSDINMDYILELIDNMLNSLDNLKILTIDNIDNNKKKLVLNYVFIMFLYNILNNSVNDPKYYTNAKNIVVYIITEYYNYVNNISLDPDEITNIVKKVREKYKDEKMAAYSGDNQSKKAQKMVDGMISKKKDDIQIKDQDISTYANQKQEEQNFVLDDKGENPDN